MKHPPERETKTVMCSEHRVWVVMVRMRIGDKGGAVSVGVIF